MMNRNSKIGVPIAHGSLHRMRDRRNFCEAL